MWEMEYINNIIKCHKYKLHVELPTGVEVPFSDHDRHWLNTISQSLFLLYWLLGDQGYGLPHLRKMTSLIILFLRIKQFEYFIKFS